MAPIAVSPLTAVDALSKRQIYPYYGGYSYWYSSGRWILAGVLIGVFVLFLLGFIVCCFTARRRRKSGQTPYKGTAWTMRVPGMRAPPPPPAYAPPPETQTVETYGNGGPTAVPKREA